MVFRMSFTTSAGLSTRLDPQSGLRVTRHLSTLLQTEKRSYACDEIHPFVGMSGCGSRWANHSNPVRLRADSPQSDRLRDQQ